MLADIIIILIMILCILLGYMRGLIKVAVKIIGLFAALIIALVLYTPVSDYIINNTEIVENLEQTIESKLYNEEEKSENTNNNVIESIEKYTEEMKEEGTKYIAKNISISIVRVRNMDRIIHNSKNTYANLKIIYKYNRKNTNNQTIQ